MQLFELYGLTDNNVVTKAIVAEIETYMLLSKQDRQKHLMLEAGCIELGTNSGHCRALLAHYLGTTCPKGQLVYMCHACNNEKCSNPKHLYWGTPGENIQDRNEANPELWNTALNAIIEASRSRTQETFSKISNTMKGRPSNNRGKK